MEYEVVKSLLVTEKYGTWVELKPGCKVRITVDDWYLDTIQEELDEYSGRSGTKTIEGLVISVDLPYDEIHFLIDKEGKDSIEIPPYVIDCLEILN